MDDAHNSAVGTSTHHHCQHNIDMDDDNNNDSTDAVNLGNTSNHNNSLVLSSGK